MKKILIILILALTTVYINAEKLTSTVDGGVIRTLPKVGQIVKKGEMLVTFYHKGIDVGIDVLKVEIEEAKELLKTKKLDEARAQKLIGRAMTENDWEEASNDAIQAKLDVEVKKLKLRELEINRALRFIPAPYDCKIKKVYLIENSGTFIGQRILDVERLN